MTANRARLAGGLYDRVALASASVVIEEYSTSFGWATRLLGSDLRGHIRAIYALVRVADELVDDMSQEWPQQARATLLDELEADTLRAVETGVSANLVVHAFALTARQFGISPEEIRPFFTSMRADLSVQSHDAASLASYVYGSAEVVGLMCLRVFVGGDEATYQELRPGALRLGAAFQKVNFLRDLNADQRDLSRTYLPDSDPAAFDDAARDAILDDVDRDLAVALTYLTQLPRSSRIAVRAAHGFYSELSRRLRATPARDIAHRRVRVPNPVKARIVANSWMVSR